MDGCQRPRRALHAGAWLCAILLASASPAWSAKPDPDQKDLQRASASEEYARLAQERRRALVIGESAYRNAPRLPGAAHDADLVSKALTQAGFAVTALKNADKQQIDRAVADFVAATQEGDVVLVYWSGHGVQRDGRNWLVPVDAVLEQPSRLPSDAIDTDAMITQLASAPARLNMLLLDACRNNPWEKSWAGGTKAMESKGLAQPPPTPTGFVIAYATAPGQTAADGGNEAGPYAQALAQRVVEPRELQEVFQSVHGDVAKATSGTQLPWVSMALGPGRFFFTLPTAEEYRQRYEYVSYGHLAIALKAEGVLSIDGDELGMVRADTRLRPRMTAGMHRVCLGHDCKDVVVIPNSEVSIEFNAPPKVKPKNRGTSKEERHDPVADAREMAGGARSRKPKRPLMPPPAADSEDDETSAAGNELADSERNTERPVPGDSISTSFALVTTISREEIRAFGYETLYDAVGGSRGVFQTNDLLVQSIGLHGLSPLGDGGDHILVNLDGHAMNDDLRGGSLVGYELLTDLEDVDRIEVVHGPGSPFQRANAFTGVLNVVAEDEGTLKPSHVAVSAQELNTVRARAHIAGKSRDGLGGWISAGAAASSGDDYDFSEFEEESGSGLSEDADSLLSGMLSGKAWVSDVTIQGNWSSWKKRIANGAKGSILGDPDAMNLGARGFLEVRYEPTFGEKLQFYSRVYMDIYTFDGVYPYADEEFGTVRDSWEGAWAGLEPRLIANPVHWLSVTLGAEASLNYVAHLTSQNQFEVYLDEDPTYQTLAGYAVAQITSGSFLDAALGARLYRLSYAETSISDPPSQTALNPRLSLIMKPGEKNILQLVGGRAVRMPSPYELNYNDEGYTQLPAPNNIVPEVIYTGELEYTRRFSDIIGVSGSVYYNRITNLIDALEVENWIEGETITVLQYDNVDDVVETVGEEFELRRSWHDGWMLSFNQSFQRTREGGLLDGAQFNNSPEHLFALKAAMPLATSGLHTLASRVRFETGRNTLGGRTTRPALVWDFTTSGQLKSLPLSYAAGIQNLLNWEVSHPAPATYVQDSMPQPGRTFWLKLQMKPPRHQH